MVKNDEGTCYVPNPTDLVVLHVSFCESPSCQNQSPLTLKLERLNSLANSWHHKLERGGRLLVSPHVLLAFMTRQHTRTQHKRDKPVLPPPSHPA